VLSGIAESEFDLDTGFDDLHVNKLAPEHVKLAPEHVLKYLHTQKGMWRASVPNMCDRARHRSPESHNGHGIKTPAITTP
jgi:hypothetical protein